MPARDNIGVRYCLDDRATYRLCLARPKAVQTFVKHPIDRAADQVRLYALRKHRSALQAGTAPCASRIREARPPFLLLSNILAEGL